MVPLLRSCILSRKKLFTQEIISLKRIFLYSTCSDVKKQTPTFQENNSENNEDDQRLLVYNGPATTVVQMLKGFSIASSIVSIVAQPILWMKMIEDDNTMTLALTFMAINGIGVGNPILVYFLTKRYVIDMYYYPKERKYVAQVFNFFFRKREIKFTPKDVVEPFSEVSKLFTTFYAKNHPLLFDPIFSSDSKHYFILMGYKKVEDFEVKKKIVPPVNQLPVNKSKEVTESKNKKTR